MTVRDQLTAATADLMRRHGVAGTGVAGILEASGVARRSIYLNFPGGKAELVAAATRSVGETMTDIIRRCGTAPDPLQAFTRLWSVMLAESDFRAGCPIVAAALGREEASDATDAAVEVFRDWSDALVAGLRDAGVEESVRESLATTIIATVEGAVILSQAKRSTVPLEQATGHLGELLALHTPSDGSAQ